MELHVKAIDGKNLPTQKRDLIDPYLKLTLVDKHNKKIETIEEKTTQFIKDSVNPTWNEEFTFTIRSIESNYLQVTLMDKDSGSKDDVIQSFDVALETLALGEVIDIKQKLEKPKKAKHSPLISLQLFISKKNMTPWVNAPFQPLVLKLGVLEAKELPKVDTFGKIDSYITMNWHNSTKKYKTQVIEKNFEPQWNAQFSLRVTDISKDVLELTLKDYDKGSKNDPISTYQIKASELVPGEEIDKWVDFEPIGPKIKQGGKVHLTFQLSGDQPREPPKEEEPKEEKKEKKQHKHSKKEKKSKSEEIAAAVEVVAKPKEEKPVEGNTVLNFKIIECKDLKGDDLDGKSDPYVKYTYGKQSNKTEIIKDSSSPKFNNSLFKVTVTEEDEDIRFEAFDHDFMGKDDSLGYIEFKMNTFQKGEISDKWYPLKNKKEQQAGQIHLAFHLDDVNAKPFEGKELPAEEKVEEEWTYEWYYVDSKSISFSSHSDAKSLSSWSSSDEKAKSLSEYHREKRKRRVLKGTKKVPAQKNEAFKGFTFFLKVAEAQRVPAADANGKSDPYVKYRMNTTEKKTKVIENNLNPVWNEQVELPILDRNSDFVHFAIWDDDISHDDELAICELKLKDLKPGKVFDQWLDTTDKKGKKLDTKLHIVAHLAEKGDKPFEEKEIKLPVLNVMVVEGADVPKTDLIGKTDAFAKVGLKGGQLLNKTKTIDNSFTPIWSEKFVIQLNDPKNDIFSVELWDEDVKNDDMISKAEIPIGKFEPGKVVDDWWPLQVASKKYKEGGRIHLKFQVDEEGKAPAFD